MSFKNSFILSLGMSNYHFLTISILTYNRSRFLMETLDNIGGQITKDGLENDIVIHVNDNCSPDSTEADVTLFKKNNPKIKMTYARNKSNLGFDRNVDLAARASKTQWTWLMSDDDRIVEGSLKYLVEKLRALPNGISFATIPANVYDNKLKEKLMDFSREFSSDRIFQGIDPEIARLSPFYLGIGAHIFKTEKWPETKNLERYIGSQIVQLYFMLYWIGKKEKIAYFNRVCLDVRYNNSAQGEDAVFGIFYGCLHNIPEMVYDTVRIQQDQRMILRAFFKTLPFQILSFKKTEKWGILPSKRTLQLFSEAKRHYSFIPAFWLLYPAQVVVPSFFARLLKKSYDEFRKATVLR